MLQSVPQETTLLGRVAGNSNASRFRKGRLESAQMIIPSLFAANIRNDNGEPSDGEDDDGLSVLERENIREILAKLAQSNPGEDQSEGIFLSDTKDVLGRKIQTNQAMTTMESVLGTPAVPLPKARVAASSSTPRGNLIAVPTNEMVREPEEEETVAAPAPPVKKMSRFVVPLCLSRANDIADSRLASWVSNSRSSSSRTTYIHSMQIHSNYLSLRVQLCALFDCQLCRGWAAGRTSLACRSSATGASSRPILTSSS